MGYSISDDIQKALESLQQAICRDTYDLAQNDHDAILMKVKELKEFIDGRYQARRPSK